MNLIDEVKRYEAGLAWQENCHLSWIQPIQRGIVLNGIPHSGTAAHICSLKATHQGECQCRCGKKQLNKK